MADAPSKPQPKKRVLKLEPQILAYLGDYLMSFEESVKRLAMASVKEVPAATSKTHYTSAR